MVSENKTLKDILSAIDGIKEYLQLKNKELWSGAEWSSGQKSVPGISRYQRIKIYPWDTLEGIELERAGSTFRGEGMFANVSSATYLHTSYGAVLSIDENDNATIKYNVLVHHYGNSGTHTNTAAQIVKIVGIEPLLPERLQKLIGGGDAVNQGDGRNAVSKRNARRLVDWAQSVARAEEQILLYFRNCGKSVRQRVHRLFADITPRRVPDTGEYNLQRRCLVSILTGLHERLELNMAFKGIWSRAYVSRWWNPCVGLARRDWRRNCNHDELVWILQRLLHMGYKNGGNKAHLAEMGCLYG